MKKMNTALCFTVLAAALLLCFAACGPGTGTIVIADQYHGEWTTSEPEWTDNYDATVKIDASYITIDNVAYTAHTHIGGSKWGDEYILDDDKWVMVYKYTTPDTLRISLSVPPHNRDTDIVSANFTKVTPTP